MKRLLFNNPVFNDVGINVTVRYGAKWLGSENSRVEVYDLDEKSHCGYAKIIRTSIFRFYDIPARLVEQEHDESCRTYNGLWNTMKLIYPGMKEDSWVTVVEFYFDSIEV